MTSLLTNLVWSKPVAGHKAEKQNDGSGDFLISRSPASNRALGDVEERRAADLRQAVAVERGAELVGGHLQPRRRAQGRVVAEQVGQRGLTAGQFVNSVLNQRCGCGDLLKSERRQSADAAPRQFIPESIGMAVIVVEQRDELNGGHVAVGLGVGGHFNLQRASAPFRTTTTLPDKMSGCQGANSRAAA